MTVRTEKLNAAKQAEQGLREKLSDGYANFAAEESYTGKGDADETCNATLYVNGHPYYGNTGTQYCNHAEMNALHQFLTGTSSDEWSKLDTAEIQCEKKPCCIHCSTILGFLGIVPKDKTVTHKVKKKMGSTEWGLSRDVKDFICARGGGVTYNVLMDALNSVARL